MRINDAIWDEIEAENRTLKTCIAALKDKNWQLEEDRLLDMDQGYYRKLETRIAELEAALSSKVEQADVFHTEWRRAKDALADESARVEEFRSTLAETCKQRDAILERAEQAEAKLAERDRMLRWLWEHTPKVNYSYEQWLADLRARDPAPDPCDNCEWHAPGTDQGPCTTDDPREQPDDCPRAEEGEG